MYPFIKQEFKLHKKGIQMQREDKIQQILSAYNNGMPIKKIDPVGGGSSVRILLKGGNPTERKVNQMYLNVMTYKKQVMKDVKLNLALAPSASLTVLQKRQLLIDAVLSGIPKSTINPKSHGASMARLLEGKPVWPKTLERMYSNLLDYAGYNEDQSNREEAFYKQKIKLLEETLLSVIEQMQVLETQVGLLQSQLSSLNHLPKPNENAARKICGLTVIQKTDRVKGRAYKRWYAIDNRASKRRFIYIGKDLSKAKDKIQKALKKGAQ